ncbi:hypothetical protein [Anaerocolumna chitinilytica]|uniref:Uncharacterized protein n=1 Tax=Anaerocolumna chitinilytica TaxID=1727145 RepID=A0A7I8DNR7_9FIRM|nr:hypothetical protein [Anaerocolumna chitinilytica]BCK00041.1 hypothetical protein bsdcttw_30810 [Anaerocolumna chitinilytica]
MDYLVKSDENHSKVEPMVICGVDACLINGICGVVACGINLFCPINACVANA